MSRVITFSRYFPAYHPRAGEPTYFVEKLLKGFPEYTRDDYTPMKSKPNEDLFSIIPIAFDKWKELGPKYHTIRSGKRWKAGDKFSPRVWLGKPYASPQITIAPDIEVKKVWDFEIDSCGVISVGGYYDFSDDPDNNYEILAQNDGLLEIDLLHWFNKPFQGQIICWNNEINY